ncbi:hypothetical protein [Wolinella succinogenes]|nr:hypothetical protein [Wolinella succinogenes]
MRGSHRLMFDLYEPVGLIEVFVTGGVILSLMALGYRWLKRRS